MEIQKVNLFVIRNRDIPEPFLEKLEGSLGLDKVLNEDVVVIAVDVSVLDVVAERVHSALHRGKQIEEFFAGRHDLFPPY